MVRIDPVYLSEEVLYSTALFQFSLLFSVASECNCSFDKMHVLHILGLVSQTNRAARVLV